MPAITFSRLICHLLKWQFPLPVSFTSWLLSLRQSSLPFHLLLPRLYKAAFHIQQALKNDDSLASIEKSVSQFHPEKVKIYVIALALAAKTDGFVSKATFDHINVLSTLCYWWWWAPIRLSRGRVMIPTRTQTQTCCDRGEFRGKRGRQGTVWQQGQRLISPSVHIYHRAELISGGSLSLTCCYQICSSGRVSHGTKSKWNVELYQVVPAMH